MVLSVKAIAEQLQKVSRLLARRLIKGHVGAVFPLEQGKEAMEGREEKGSESAKVTIRVGRAGPR